MRAERVAWERAGEVRRAARGWREAGAIDGGTLDRIEALYPDPRILPGIVWRALGFFFGSLAMLGVLGAALLMLGANRESALGSLCLFVGVAGLVAAELQERSPTLCARGGAGAASFWGVLFVIAGSWILLAVAGVHGDERRIILAVATLLWTAAGRRWGPWLYAALAALSFFLLLSTFPRPRLLWLVAGVLLAAAGHRNLDRAALTPSHRESAAALLATALLAIYAAINIYSLDTWLIESFGFVMYRWSAAPAPETIRTLSAIATALFPPALLVWGLRSRRTLLLDAGVIALALSLLTLRHYVHIAALWVVLAGSGALLVAVIVALERSLSRAPDRERFGFTAEPLLSVEGRARALEVVPVVVGLAPGASPERPDDGFAGGGGGFGGGGASGSV